MGVANTSRQLNGFREVQPDFARGMGVRTEGDRHPGFVGHREDLPARIDLPAVFPQAGGVQFDAAVGLGRCFQEVAEQRGTIAFRDEAELLRQVGVSNDLEQSGRCCPGQGLEILGPDLISPPFLPVGYILGIVDVPTL